MTDLSAAAQSLIVSLKAPAQFHSVWIQADIDETGQATGRQHLCVSVRPGHEHQVKVPTSHQGIPVVNVPWPESA